MAGITRRDLLRGMGVSAAATAAVAAGSSTAWADESATWQPVWADEADVVVVGFGGSGVMASIAAAEAGASVIAIEANEHNMGGNLGCSTGAIDGCPGADVDEWVARYEHNTFKAGAPADQIRTVLEEAASCPDWLPTYGIDVNWIDAGDPTGHTFPVHYIQGTVAGREGVEGHYLFEALAEKAAELGVEPRLATKGVRLVQHPQTGDVVGVIAQGPEGEIALKARRGVIVAAGSFEANEWMQMNYMVPGVFMQGSGVPTNDGSGIAMCQKAGAALWHMGQFHTAGFQAVLPSSEAGISVGADAPNGCGYLMVDCNGRRFLNEAFAMPHNADHKPAWEFASCNMFNAETFGSADPAVLRWTQQVSDYVHLPMFIIVDQKTLDAADPWIHTNDGHGVLRGYDSIMHFYEDDHQFLSCSTNAKAIEEGWIFQGATLEELAANIRGYRPCGSDEDRIEGIDAEALAASVAAYNAACAAGVDEQFGRRPDTLVPLAEEGPYYAVQVQNAMSFCEGGPLRDGLCRTLDPFFEPIGRLYNTGECGSFNTMVYSICGIVQALATGRIAGREAATLEPWE